MVDMKMNVTYIFPLHTRIMSRCWRLFRWIPVVRRVYWWVMWTGLRFEIEGMRSRRVRLPFPSGRGRSPGS